MNPRELLARLNVPAVRYSIGSGGLPELTNIDIAGALGLVKNEFAREVFCAIWWPDGSTLSGTDVNKAIFERIVAEYVSRERAIVTAKLELHMAESEAVARRVLSTHDKQILAACQRNVGITKARHWPWNAEIYNRIGRAVIDEKRFPSRCPDCQGRAEVIIENKVIKCERCKGTGVKHRPIVWRATQLGITDTAFGKGWYSVYEWAVRLVGDAESDGAEAIRKVMARDSEPA